MRQHDQAQRYFRSAATEWQNKAIDGSGTYNVIEGRNRAVMDVLRRTENARRFLDVGCGTGQLVIMAAEQGLDAEGIDFADEMISKCEANARATGVKPDSKAARSSTPNLRKRRTTSSALKASSNISRRTRLMSSFADASACCVHLELSR
jgi:2-polyprenyl-3-methyl-5-hydroxy-6-metoxy-1,4-benzoquinol methylase